MAFLNEQLCARVGRTLQIGDIHRICFDSLAFLIMSVNIFSGAPEAFVLEHGP